MLLFSGASYYQFIGSTPSLELTSSTTLYFTALMHIRYGVQGKNSMNNSTFIPWITRPMCKLKGRSEQGMCEKKENRLGERKEGRK